MKNKLLSYFLLLVGLLLIIGCSQENSEVNNNNTSDETVIYQAENGDIEIPKAPKKIVALTNAPNVFALDGSLVGVDEWTKANPLFKEDLKDIPVVSENNPEEILALKPDLIIAGAHMENLEELEKIAPTVVYTWGKLDYLEQQIEIGKLLNKTDEAEKWVEAFTSEAEVVGDKIKAEYGEDVSVTVFETDAKNFYVFGDSWARGTELLYQAMSLKMPHIVTKDTSDEGYKQISLEVLGDYAGDFIVVSKGKADNEFMKSDTWQTIPAVNSDQVIEIETEKSTYSDPITLEFLLEEFEKGFLGK